MRFLVMMMAISSMKPTFVESFCRWTPGSWMRYPVKQIPEYPDVEILETVKTEIKKRPPLVFAGEIRRLKEDLARVEEGDGFILQAGPCAETFDHEKIQEMREFFTLMTQLSLILQFYTEKQVVRIGRIGGQFAKPRSQMYEKDNCTLTYRGDIIHDINNRTVDANRMMTAYYHSLSVLNTLRSYLRSGELDLRTIENWETSMFSNALFNKIISIIKKYNVFYNNQNPITRAYFREPEFYISHEALLLHYEESVTKRENKTGLYYNCGAHTIWLGERTRESEGHIEYLSGIENPIGIKVGSSTNMTYLCELINRLNPRREKGKIMLIFRLGSHNINKVFPDQLERLKQSNLSFMIMTDPCHGNTLSVKCNQDIKTRRMEDIIREIKDFIRICVQYGYFPSGIHLEITHEPVTECIGQNVTLWTLMDNYKTLVDPRLNALQTIELVSYIATVLGDVVLNVR